MMIRFPPPVRLGEDGPGRAARLGLHANDRRSSSWNGKLRWRLTFALAWKSRCISPIA